MTNAEIIMQEKIKAGLNLDCELHTYAVWNSLGYSIKKGSKAIIKCKLWKHTTVKNKSGKEEEKMFLTNASLFDYSQVIKRENK